jgi:hypothetical protein
MNKRMISIVLTLVVIGFYLVGGATPGELKAVKRELDASRNMATFLERIGVADDMHALKSFFGVEDSGSLYTVAERMRYFRGEGPVFAQLLDMDPEVAKAKVGNFYDLALLARGTYYAAHTVKEVYAPLSFEEQGEMADTLMLLGAVDDEARGIEYAKRIRDEDPVSVKDELLAMQEIQEEQK